MTTLNRAISLYINGDLPGGRNALLEGLTANPPNQKPCLMQGDACPLRVFFRKPGAVGDATTAYTLEEGYTLYLVGKLSAELKTGDVLFSVNAWTSPGEGEEFYSGVLNLSTEELDAAFEAATSGTLDVAIDIEYRNAGNTERVTYRADVQLCRQGYQGSEPVPTPNVAFALVSPSGYVFSITIDDHGEINKERIQ